MEKELSKLSEEGWVDYANEMADKFIKEHLGKYSKNNIVWFIELLYERVKHL
jgi:hypothetical protein